MRARIRLALLEGGFGVAGRRMTRASGRPPCCTSASATSRRARSRSATCSLVMGYLAQLYAPLETLSKKVANAAERRSPAPSGRSRCSTRRPTWPSGRTRGRSTRAAGAVEFRDVSFAYDDGRAGARRRRRSRSRRAAGSASPGATGAGKTTLVSLLTRFYDPTDGRILLDGVDLRDYRLADLRNQFAIVLQEPVLFSTSDRREHRLRPPGGDRRRRSSRRRGRPTRTTSSPRCRTGYDTAVGERGMRLSGGERQRISLARAFLKDAPILILDEPTSSVDVRDRGARSWTRWSG